MTPDSHFILDKHPTLKNCVIGAGFSGHGFKMAPVTGEILTRLLLNEEINDYDMNKFAIKRFSKTK